MPDKFKLSTAASVAVAGLVVAAGATAAITANADTTGGSTPSATASASAQPGERDGGRGHGPRGTEVSGTEAAKVTAAVKAKDSAVTVDHVMKDDDGSYHVMGTKDGQRIGYEVSKDLATVTLHQHDGRHGGPGGRGGHEHTTVTGAESTRVSQAVKAKDSGVTVEQVRKDPDGSYDVMGTKSGERVMVEVSKDLKTVTVRTGGPQDGDRQRGGSAQQGQQDQQPTGEETPA